VVFGYVVAVKSGIFGRQEEFHPVIVGLRKGFVAEVDVIEDAELHGLPLAPAVLSRHTASWNALYSGVWTDFCQIELMELYFGIH
jgi:hypothetical protein